MYFTTIPLDHSDADSDCHRMCSVAGTQLVSSILDVTLNRGGTDTEFARYRAVVQAIGQETQDYDLLPCQLSAAHR
jgi:hypothetical protein